MVEEEELDSPITTRRPPTLPPGLRDAYRRVLFNYLHDIVTIYSSLRRTAHVVHQHCLAYAAWLSRRRYTTSHYPLLPNHSFAPGTSAGHLCPSMTAPGPSAS